MSTLSAKKLDYVLILLVFMTPIVCIASDIASPSLPYVARFFHVSHFESKISLVLFSVAMGFTQPFLGPISDRFGRRYFCLGGLTLTIIACVMSVISINISMFYASRILQGIAGSIVSVAIKSMMIDLYKGHRLSKAMSYYGMGWAMTPIAAPLIGGYLQHWFNWQASFVFIALYALLTLFWALFVIKETGVVVKKNMRYWAGVYKEILKHPVFLVGIWFTSVQCAILLIFYIDAPFIFQETLGVKVQNFGQIMFFLGLVYFAGNFLNRILIQWVSLVKVIGCGILISLSASILMLFFAFFFKLSAVLILVPIVIIFLVDGMIFSNTLTICLLQFKKHGGTAGGVSGGLLSLLSAGMSGVVSIFHAATLMPMALSFSVLTFSTLILFVLVFRKARI